ncbi:MAG TPA: hypothetical protein VK142_06955 [Bacillota bacterium]|nr:hypothetical protein [Bacillota bacterium]
MTKTAEAETDMTPMTTAIYGLKGGSLMIFSFITYLDMIHEHGIIVNASVHISPMMFRVILFYHATEKKAFIP